MKEDYDDGRCSEPREDREHEEQAKNDAEGQLKSGRIRGKTFSVVRMSKRVLEVIREENAGSRDLPHKPRERGECLQGDNAQRPCPFVSCKHHLYLDVAENGNIKLNFPHLEVWQLPHTCALDVADRGGITLEEVGVIMNLTRERVRQIESNAINEMRVLARQRGLGDYFGKEVRRGHVEETDEIGFFKRSARVPCLSKGCSSQTDALQPHVPPELRGYCAACRRKKRNALTRARKSAAAGKRPAR